MKSNFGRIAACAATLSVAFATAPSYAQISDDTVKIGVLTDQIGLYADATGPGSVEAVRMAIADFGGKVAGKPIAMVDADHQNKADVGAAIARRWYEQENVDVVVDFANSAVAFAVLELSKQKNKAMLVSSAGSSDLTGKACSPNWVQWTYNTYALANSTAVRSSRKARRAGTSSPSITRSATRYATTRRRPSKSSAARLRAKYAIPSTAWISHPICFRPRARMPTSWRSPIPAGISPVRSGRPRNSGGEQAEARGVPDANERHSCDWPVRGKGLQLTTAYYWDLDDKTRDLRSASWPRPRSGRRWFRLDFIRR